LSITSAISSPMVRSWVYFVSHDFGGCFDSALEQHRVVASGQALHAFHDDCVRQHGRGGGAIAGDVVGLGGGFFQELRAHILERVLQLDFLGDGDAVVRDGGGTEFFIQGDVASFGTQRGRDGRGEGLHALGKTVTCFFSED
jgi:hypothetical protein